MTKNIPIQIKLTPGELELLEILWSNGPLTIAEAHQKFLEKGRNISYPTTQTRLNRLTDKGVLRKNGQYPATYEALVQQGDISGRYFDLLETLCGGSIAPLMIHLAEKRDFNSSEIEVLKNIINQHEQRKNP